MENTTHITLALESAPTVREVSMISFNPSTTWGTALCVRESRSSKTFAHYNFWHNHKLGMPTLKPAFSYARRAGAC